MVNPLLEAARCWDDLERDTGCSENWTLESHMLRPHACGSLCVFAGAILQAPISAGLSIGCVGNVLVGRILWAELRARCCVFTHLSAYSLPSEKVL